MWLYADGELIGHLDDWSKSIFRQIYSNVSVIGKYPATCLTDMFL